jgi:hypothetical protein
MKSPFTPEYLKMASAAAEVQAFRLKDKIFQAGDCVIFESAFTPSGMVSMIDEHSHNIPQDNAQVWIPQLHQLMGLFGNFPASLEAMRSGLNFPVTGASGGYFETLRSWEECTLAVLMLKRADKVWNGEKWVKAEASKLSPPP